MAAPRVVVIGDLMTDVVAIVPDVLAIGSDTAASIASHGGGSAANTACWLASLGVDATLVARRGADPLGVAAQAAVAAAGVTCEIAVDPVLPTGTCLVLVDGTGERTMLPDRGANLTLTVDDLPDDAFAPGSHLHLSGYVLFEPQTRPVALEALQRARAAGMTTSVDPASAAPLAAVGGVAFLGWTDGVDVCLPNADEALALTGCAQPAEAARLLARRYRHVVVTCGSAGPLSYDGHTLVAVPAPTVTAVDTTGAGDAFAAGYLAAWLGGAPAYQALENGAATAARAVTTTGARPPIQPIQSSP